MSDLYPQNNLQRQTTIVFLEYLQRDVHHGIVRMSNTRNISTSTDSLATKVFEHPNIGMPNAALPHTFRVQGKATPMADDRV